MKFLHAFFFSLFLCFSLTGPAVFAEDEKPPTPSQQFERIKVDDIFSTPGNGDTDKGFTYRNLITDSQGETPGGGNTVVAIMLNAIDILLLLIGTFAFIAVAYGGFLFMQAGGDEGKIDTGKTVLTQAVLGLVIAFGSYVLVRFIESFLS